jgi:hypothetical protein
MGQYCIENMDDEVLEIRNTYFEPTAFYFPWVISINGTRSTCTAIEIKSILNHCIPRFP